MKIVFFSYIHSPQFHDPEAWIAHIKPYTGILEAMASRHTVISIEQISFKGIYHKNGVAYHFLNSGKKKLLFPWALHRYIKGLQPDAVIIHGLHFPFQVLQLHFHLPQTVPVIVQNHAEKPYFGIRRYLQKKADAFVDAYLFTSLEMGEDWLRKGIIQHHHKIKAVMEASSFFYPADKLKAKEITQVTGEPVYLWVGRLNENKDPLAVVNAFLRFLQSYPEARLYMVFQTTELLEKIKQTLLKSSHGQKIILVGKVSHSDLQPWYNSADFIISGSHYEGSGIAICEAMSCGCIPIITQIHSFRKMTNEGNCGILYEPGNEDALLQALLLSKQMDLVQEKEKVLKQFKDDLSFEAIAAQMELILAAV